MLAVAQPVMSTMNALESGYSEHDAIQALYTELEKGIQSMKQGDVYTVEEAWEEIDKI